MYGKIIQTFGNAETLDDPILGLVSVPDLHGCWRVSAVFRNTVLNQQRLLPLSFDQTDLQPLGSNAPYRSLVLVECGSLCFIYLEF